MWGSVDEGKLAYSRFNPLRFVSLFFRADLRAVSLCNLSALPHTTWGGYCTLYICRLLIKRGMMTELCSAEFFVSRVYKDIRETPVLRC